MHPIDWVAYTAFAATSLALLVTISSLRTMLEAGADRGTRVRNLRRMGVVIGLWQISTGLCVVSISPSTSWTGGIALFGMGGMFLFGAWLSRKTGFPPWWAPE